MNFLCDTHILLWAALNSPKLSRSTEALLSDPENQFYVSAASIWEVSIKLSRGDLGFEIHPQVLRKHLLANGYKSLDITADHAIAVSNLPLLHRDPFDRILIAQATVENLTLLTADRQVVQYPGPIRKV